MCVHVWILFLLLSVEKQRGAVPVGVGLGGAAVLSRPSPSHPA